MKLVKPASTIDWIGLDTIDSRLSHSRFRRQSIYSFQIPSTVKWVKWNSIDSRMIHSGFHWKPTISLWISRKFLDFNHKAIHNFSTVDSFFIHSTASSPSSPHHQQPSPLAPNPTEVQINLKSIKIKTSSTSSFALLRIRRAKNLRQKLILFNERWWMFAISIMQLDKWKRRARRVMKLE
jgi:hypothetical protein